MLDQLKDTIRKALPELDFVMGWGMGFDALHATPLFMYEPEDVDKLVWGPLNVHNLATYLPALKGKKVGIVVKGCDSRSVVELLQEKLIERDDVVIFGAPCQGTVSLTKIRNVIGNTGLIDDVTIENGKVTVNVSGQSHEMFIKDIRADKCSYCRFPNAVLSDHFVGEERAPQVEEDGFEDLAEFESQSFEERRDFWMKEMDRCIRCYACRNACPLCVCRDHCVAQSRDPHWLSQQDGVRDKLMFQIIHATHLAGRCTGCGECERACPVDIPVLLFKRTFNSAVKKTFDYDAGLDTEATPPLLAFKANEDNIKEKEW